MIIPTKPKMSETFKNGQTGREQAQGRSSKCACQWQTFNQRYQL